MQIPEDQVSFAVDVWGYTEREARFLWIVTAFSGHFIREQYARYASVGRGRPDHHLAESLLRTAHSPATYAWGSRARTQRYHVQGRALYRAFGRENSNHRKATTSNATIAVRIAALDFVLSELQAEYLLSDRDRLQYLEHAHGIADSGLVPSRTYPARGPRGTTPAVTVPFPDRFPMSVAADGTVTFTYVDAPDDGIQPFQSHVLRYAPLLAALRTPARFVFVSGVRPKLARAPSVFRSVVGETAPTLTPELLRYFELEDRILRKDVAGLRKRDYDERLDLAKRFAAPTYQKLLERWRSGGVAGARTTAPDTGVSFLAFHAESLDA